MMSNSDPTRLESIDEQLTAYLDGELSPQESLSLEKSLVEDESLRLRLAELRKAYDLLDELPETPHDQRFTQSTLEHVIHEVRADKSKPSPATDTVAVATSKRFSYRFPLLLVIVALAGGGLGAVFRYQQIDREIGSLGLAANISGLITVNELPVAVELAKEKVAIRYLKEYFAERLIPAIPQTNWERRTWFNSLTPVQQAKIESDRQSLLNMDNQSRSRYAAIESQIQSRPDQEEIHETIRLVGLVMDNLQSFEKLEMDELAKDIRIHYLRQKMYYFAAMHYFSNRLSEQDQKTIKAWSDKVLEPGLISLGRDMGPNRPRFEGMIYMYLFRKMNGFASTQDEQLEEEVIRLLLPDLSDDARVLLANVRQDNQLMLLANSCLTPNKLASDDSIVEFYDKIPLNRREGIEVADPELTRNRIRQMLDEAARRRIRPRP